MPDEEVLGNNLRILICIRVTELAYGTYIADRGMFIICVTCLNSVGTVQAGNRMGPQIRISQHTRARQWRKLLTPRILYPVSKEDVSLLVLSSWVPGDQKDTNQLKAL